jgi:cobalt-zinc-cadmium efflux system membrane fusion protein
MTKLRARGGAASALLLSIAFLAGLTGCDSGEQTASAKVPNKQEVAGEPRRNGLLQLTADQVRRAGVKVERIGWAEHQTTVALFGTVEANRDRLARVLPPIAGRLARISANLGDRVSRGQILATLDSPELGEIRAMHSQSQTELNLAKAAHERAQRLVTDGSIAQKEVLRAKSDYEKAQAALNVSASKLATLGVPAIPPAGTSSAALAVAAPFDGTIIEKPAVLGEYAQAYQPLFTIADLSALWIEVSIYDRDIGDVVIGAPATVAIGAYPGRTFAGEVTYISNLFDRETRTVKARVEIANRDDSLKPGMFANVLIEKQADGRTLRVPEAALTLLHGQLTAFVATGDGFEPRPVEIGERAGGQVTITSGLEPGDDVVTAGVYALKARLLSSQISAAE